MFVIFLSDKLVGLSIMIVLDDKRAMSIISKNLDSCFLFFVKIYGVKKRMEQISAR